MKRINTMSTIGVIVVFGTILLRFFIKLPDFFYGLGVGIGGTLGLVVISEYGIKK
jgi:hypothetical protein